MKNTVIVTAARSGSCWLMSAFEQIQNKTAYSISPGEALPLDKNLSDADRIRKLKAVTPWVTKVITDEMIDLELIGKDNTEFVWLYRRDCVQHFLSQTLAMQTGIFNRGPGQNYAPPSELVITPQDTDFFADIIQKRDLAYQKYQSWFDYEIAYEDLFDHNPWQFRSTDMMATAKLNNYSAEWLNQAQDILKDRGII